MPYEAESYQKARVLLKNSKWYALEDFYTLTISFVKSRENLEQQLERIQIRNFYDIETRFNAEHSYICTSYGLWKDLLTIENLNNDKKLHEMLIALYNRKDIVDRTVFEEYYQLSWSDEDTWQLWNFTSLINAEEVMICKHFKGFPFKCADKSCTGRLYDSYQMFQNDFIIDQYLKNAKTESQRKEARRLLLKLDSHSYTDQSPNGSFIWD